MTAILALISGAGIAYTLTAGHYRQVIRQLDNHGYDSHRTADDIRALDHQLAVAIADRGQWRRKSKRLEQVARSQAGLLAARRHTPIPLPAHRTPVPTYGSNRP
jgi:hypothetical protein